MKLWRTGFAVVICLAGGLCFAQRFGGGGRGGGDLSTVRTARETPTGSTGTPNWTNHEAFERDVFTFARVRYDSEGGFGGPGGGRGRSGGFGGPPGGRGRSFGGGFGGGYHRWAIDYPDSDLNLSFRLQQMTSLKVDPDGRVIDLLDKDLAHYPWIYIVEPGALVFSDDEAKALRNYLMNGGFLMIDDFWGEVQWEHFYPQLKKVFPDREPVELPMTHPVFHSVFPLKVTKNQLQCPNIRTGEQSQQTGVTWENHSGEECRDVHFRSIFDDKGRMVVFIAHNTDNGDGWEREGENIYYFHEFSEKRAYPLGINVIFYAMTH